jgi:ankyrin repeat protein
MSSEDVIRAHAACVSGDLKTLEEIFEQHWEKHNKLDLDRHFLDKNGHNCTLMHKAARNNQADLMDFLFQKGASVSTTDQIGATPLFYACLGNCIDAVTFLSSHGAQVNIRDKREVSPLQIALAENQYELADLLILCKADVHFKIGNKGNTILHIAIKEGDIKKIDWLVDQHGAQFSRTDRNGNSCLAYAQTDLKVFTHVCELAARGGLKDLAKLFKWQNDMGENVFHSLACNEDKASCTGLILDKVLDYMLQMMDLLNVGEIVNESTKTRHNYTPLHMAVSNQNVEFVEKICENDIVQPFLQLYKVNKDGDTALHLAVKNGNVKIAKILIAADPLRRSLKIMNVNKMTPVMLARESNLIIEELEETTTCCVIA